MTAQSMAPVIPAKQMSPASRPRSSFRALMTPSTTGTATIQPMPKVTTDTISVEANTAHTAPLKLPPSLRMMIYDMRVRTPVSFIIPPRNSAPMTIQKKLPE